MPHSDGCDVDLVFPSGASYVSLIPLALINVSLLLSVHGLETKLNLSTSNTCLINKEDNDTCVSGPRWFQNHSIVDLLQRHQASLETSCPHPKGTRPHPKADPCGPHVALPDKTHTARADIVRDIGVAASNRCGLPTPDPAEPSW